MEVRRAPVFVLLCLGVATAQQSAGGSARSVAASPELTKCQFSQKELHTTVRSAALSALSGICDPVEMEARLLGMEQRLKRSIEELKDTLTKLLIDGVAYDYDEEGDAVYEQHRYTGAASASSALKTTDGASETGAVTETASGAKDSGASAAGGGATLTQHGGLWVQNKIQTAGDARETTSSAKSGSQRRATSSTASGAGASADAGAAAAQQAGTSRTSSQSHSYRWSSSSQSGSSRGSSGSAGGAEMGAGEVRVADGRRASGDADQETLTSGAIGNRTVTSTDHGASLASGRQSAGSSRSSSQSYSHRWSSSSRGSSGEMPGEQSRGDASQSGVSSALGEGAAGRSEQTGGSSGSSSHRYSYERTSSTRRSSGDVSGGDAQQARAIGAEADSRIYNALGSGSRGYSYERMGSYSSRNSSGEVSTEDAQKARAIGSEGHSGSTEGHQRYGSSESASQRQSYERRTSSQGLSREAAQGRAHEFRAIGGADYSRGGTSRHSGRSHSSSRQSSQEPGSSRSSSRNAEQPPYVDFGEGGGPEQRSWFPGTSRTTAGTGVPDLSTSTTRTGGFGFGAVGEPLDGPSGGPAGVQVRAGGSAQAAGDSEVLIRDRQTYAGSAEARRPGSSAGGDSSQYAASNSSWSSSGERQVTAYDASSASRPAGASVRFSSSYTPVQGGGAYRSYSGQRSRGSSRSRSRHSSSRATRRRGQQRRRQRVTDTISSIADGQMTPLSRYPEIDRYNDTVYEVDGKRRYSYYWEVTDFRTMMETWENHHSLRSPSFYVYKGGYRMYIRVFPSRQGGNVYLHTGLTQGRYDDQLPWPFEMRLRLSLLDHSNLRHDIRSRIWDPRRLCSRWNWQRPRRSDNFECVGLGFPQSLLDGRRFLPNGAILLKLDVFLED